jgi:hypothetical protein
MALTQVPPALLTSTTGTGSTVVLSASPTFTGTVTTPGVTFSDASSQTAAASPYVLKNRIINGAMVIDQRNAGASVTPTDGQYTLDRWVAYRTQASKFTVQQNAGSVTPPAGFTNYLGATSSSAYSVISTDLFIVAQPIEGFNLADLAYGTASAKTITLSFWVRSSLTGTFGGSLFNSNANKSYTYSYTISSANTWEQKSITIPGDTASVIATNNAAGLSTYFNLGAGSNWQTAAGSWTLGNYSTPPGTVNVVGTNGATFYITGVQLEIGSTATPFERRLYGQELANCYRYYQQLNFNADIGANGMGISATKYSATDSAIANAQLLAPMRTTPTITKSQSTARFVSSGGVATVTGVTSGTYGLNGPIWVVGTNNSLAAGSNGWFDSIGSIYISAEL